jgi:hypothetical protein
MRVKWLECATLNTYETVLLPSIFWLRNFDGQSNFVGVLKLLL